MLTVGIVDANERIGKGWKGRLCSSIALWLQWEARKVGIELTESCADVLLICHAGEMGWLPRCRGALRTIGIQPDPDKRRRKPYIIAGGGVCTTPFQAFHIADALAVGEAYQFIRQLFALVKESADVSALAQWIAEYPHAIERSQILVLQTDETNPALLRDVPAAITTPDSWIDWNHPPTKGDRRVTQILLSKGCHNKCAFCQSAWMQRYQYCPDATRIRQIYVSLQSNGHRVDFLSNDAYGVPYIRDLPQVEGRRHESQSLTVRSLRDPRNLSAVVRLKPTIIRLGIEGISERIRAAFAKPISDEEVLDVFQRISESSIPVCLFYVVAAPFEQEGDREQFKTFHKTLAAQVTRGGHRIKCTTFTPVPPAPLSRYVCSSALVDSFEEFNAWRFANANDRHILWVRHRGADAQTRTEADTLDVPLMVLRDWKASEGPFDMAPSLEDFQRMKSEIIAWPFTAEQRFRASERYRKMMTENDD